MTIISSNHPVGSTLAVAGGASLVASSIAAFSPIRRSMPPALLMAGLLGGAVAMVAGLASVNEIGIRTTNPSRHTGGSGAADARDGADLERLRELRRQSDNQQRLCELAGMSSCPDPAGDQLRRELR